VIPHVTNEIKNACARSRRRQRRRRIVEIGGTVGDIESLPFLEAIRQMRQEMGRDNTCFVHVTLVPVDRRRAGAQDQAHAALRQGDALHRHPAGHPALPRRPRRPARCGEDRAFCNVEEAAVSSRATCPASTKSAQSLAEGRRGRAALKYLRIETPRAALSKWQDMLVHRAYNPQDEVSIGIVGKYVEYEDSYKSLKEALVHGALAQNLKLKVTGSKPRASRSRTTEPQLEGFDGILVPGGFGKRGIEGMLNAIRYAREKKVPYFGICLGMQTACIEFARNVCGLAKANSGEFDPATPHRIIYKLRELIGVDEMGGTMRLGAWDCVLVPGSLAATAYGKTEISERHRHRYEFNQAARAAPALPRLRQGQLRPARLKKK
jgi:CTP synthase